MIKINFRYAPGQDPQEMINIFSKRIADELPAYVSHTLETSDPYSAILLDITHDEVKRADSILSTIYNKTTAYRYCGAAIPVTGMFKDILGA